MDKGTMDGALDGLFDFIGKLWENVILPCVDGLGAIIDFIGPEITGVIVLVLFVAWLFRRAWRG